MGQQSYAPTRIDFTYLISVWRQKATDSAINIGEDEHKVLGQVLTTLLRYPTLPQDVLEPEIAKQPQPPRQPLLKSTPRRWDGKTAKEDYNYTRCEAHLLKACNLLC